MIARHREGLVDAGDQQSTPQTWQSLALSSAVEILLKCRVPRGGGLDCSGSHTPRLLGIPSSRTEPSTAGVGGLWSRVPEPELQRHLVPTLDTGKESDGQPSTSLSWGSSLKALVGGCARPLSPCSASLSVEEGH